MQTLNLFLKNICVCANNSEKPLTTKIGEYIPCRYSMSAIWCFDIKENKHSLYCREECMKDLCSSIKRTCYKCN